MTHAWYLIIYIFCTEVGHLERSPWPQRGQDQQRLAATSTQITGWGTPRVRPPGGHGLPPPANGSRVQASGYRSWLCTRRTRCGTCGNCLPLANPSREPELYLLLVSIPRWFQYPAHYPVFSRDKMRDADGNLLTEVLFVCGSDWTIT